MPDDDRHEFDVGPGDEMQRKYGWYAENRPDIHVEPDQVPEPLRDLIPYVERWAIPCDVTRGDYFEKQPEADVREFVRVVAPRDGEINAWLDTFKTQWPQAGFQFMYLLKALGEAACDYPDEIEEVPSDDA
ncbi:hypothetical protein [Paludisphaera mucosa]|uniref:DUF5069 domain-containing protein n=1 Tax=Paludisphaera mucosa TaxID=3030827 RepID=A0ABT6FIE1_9BACT|nr:hypothetical protein [Paludisphaera mucosa]MDG3007343.1 hypothetical protein [Paludisphaera mucosa]